MDVLQTIKHNLHPYTPEEQEYDACVLIAITNEDSPRLLLSRRASHLKSHAGEVSFLGGKREQHDTTNASVAIRESHEEANILPSQVQVIGELAPAFTRTGLQVKPIIGIIPADVELIADTTEVEHLFWVHLHDITQDIVKAYSVTYKGHEFKTSSFQIHDEVIWGLTGRILVNFLKAAVQRDIKWSLIL